MVFTVTETSRGIRMQVTVAVDVEKSICVALTGVPDTMSSCDDCHTPTPHTLHVTISAPSPNVVDRISMAISPRGVVRSTSCLVLRWGFRGRRIEWR